MIEQLSPEHMALAFMMNCPAWEGLYKARVAEQVRTMYSRLLDPSSARQGYQPDDFLRGYIAALQWAVTWPEQELDLATQRMMQQQVEEKQEDQPVVGGSRPPVNEEGD